MVFKKTVQGYEQFQNFLSTLNSSEKIILLFTGAPTATTSSWCSDCVAADPIIESVIEENKEKTFNFVKVSVGTRDEWKNPQSPFRTDPKLKLTSVPTLMYWSGRAGQRLNDNECSDVDMVRMIFEEL